MERNTSWLNWAALIVGGLALFFALSSRGGQPTVQVQVPGNSAGASAPGFAQGNDPRAGGPGFAQGNDPRGYGRGEGYGPQAGRGDMPFHRPHFGLFGLIGGVLKFLGFLLLIGLVMRFFFGRRGSGGPPWRRGPGGPDGSPGDAPRPAQPEHKEGESDEPTPPSTGETVRL